MLPLLRHCCAFGSHHPSTWRSIFQTPGREQKQIRSWSAQCSANNEGSSVAEKDNPQKKLALPDNSLLDARILYCTSPALGHNKEAHPESNKRVPAIVDALEKLELSPKVYLQYYYEYSQLSENYLTSHHLNFSFTLHSA